MFCTIHLTGFSRDIYLQRILNVYHNVIFVVLKHSRVCVRRIHVALIRRFKDSIQHPSHKVNVNHSSFILALRWSRRFVNNTTRNQYDMDDSYLYSEPMLSLLLSLIFNGEMITKSPLLLSDATEMNTFIKWYSRPSFTNIQTSWKCKISFNICNFCASQKIASFKSLNKYIFGQVTLMYVTKDIICICYWPFDCSCSTLE